MNTESQTIPDDIMRRARNAASSVGFLPYEERDALFAHFVRAIASERERCAKIAEEAVYMRDGTEFAVEYREEIAVSIRGEA